VNWRGSKVLKGIILLVGLEACFWPITQWLASSFYQFTTSTDWIFGLAPMALSLPPCRGTGEKPAERFKLAPTRDKRRRFTQFYDTTPPLGPGRAIIARASKRCPGAPTALSSPTSKAAAPSPFTTVSSAPAAGREPHQNLEGRPRRRPHFLPCGQG
jgi:hypothetical protein